MNQSIFKLHRRLVKSIAIVAVISLALSNSFSSAVAGETPQAVYSGTSDSSVVLNNINYTDVRNSANAVKQAVYEWSALDILKGYGNRQFGLKNTLTKEQAIALLYRAVGKEAAAQLAGETLNNARTTKKTDTISVWNDGYLQLAANDGLISQQDFTDSQTQDQTKLKKGSFNRNSPVQRQEMAYWLAKVLGLSPVYGQKDIFNSYKDWKKADPDKVPYIESILQKNIMNGDSTGNFNPTGPVTGQQSAQIISNAEEIILPTLSLKNWATFIDRFAGSKVFICAAM
ncbi:MAG TPA: S-layer homology domain-containing protein [Clostridia bacterium]|nr:S-layer homology domain-containing protein [Clostridia bacterium]